MYIKGLPRHHHFLLLLRRLKLQWFFSAFSCSYSLIIPKKRKTSLTRKTRSAKIRTALHTREIITKQISSRLIRPNILEVQA